MRVVSCLSIVGKPLSMVFDTENTDSIFSEIVRDPVIAESQNSDVRTKRRGRPTQLREFAEKGNA